MGVKLGMNGKLYYCAAGIGGVPVWTELGNVRNLTLNLSKGEADVTTRGNNGWRANVGTLKEGSIEFEMVWDPADEGFAAIFDGWLNDTVLGFAVMDGDIETAGTQGLWADCSVINCTRQEGLEEAMLASITIKPTYSANAATWKTIAAA